MKVVVLGASGMLGSMITDLLAHDGQFEVTATVREICQVEQWRTKLPTVRWVQFNAASPDLPRALGVIDGHAWVVNAIGITKPLIHDDNPDEVERAIRINALFPLQLGTCAQAAGAQVIQIATDCVYSGLKGNYVESDAHDALDVYGKTKSLGEATYPCMYHLRCSIIGPEPKDYKFLIEWFRRQPLNARVSGYINHRWNGVTTLHFARVVQGIIKAGGRFCHLQHLVPTGTVTKSDMLHEFAGVYGRQDIVVKDVAAAQVIDRTLGTVHSDLNQQLWHAAGYDWPPTVPDMIQELGQYNYRLAA
jgi:dTDP-4-dehydrorhamnose reductase